MSKPSWTIEALRTAVKNERSIRAVIMRLGLVPAGGNYRQVHKFIKVHRLDTSHFKGQGWNKGLKLNKRAILSLPHILTKNSSFQSFKLKKRLLNAGMKKERCEECGWSKRAKDGRCPVELDHINGDSTDNRIVNLRILCPNCHSLKPTHRGLNQKRKK